MPGLEKGAQNGNKLGKIYKNTIVDLKDYNKRKYICRPRRNTKE